MNTESREPINDAEHAPPRTLWYHATLGAEEASSYLAQRHPGSYLVRKSPKHADSYRLSVVDANHKIVHFTIELKYGLVLLGAQSFTSLSALVSHFASKGQLFFDSQLLLVNPVPPSNYVQPHRVRVKLPYTQAPDTDELCVQFGEILIVHDQPEEDWIWAESLLTGHSGSVALDIVEPVPTSADPFLGYVWFNGERAKAELVADLSAPKCRVGTFIIRPSESPSTEADCTSYTILVRSKSQVEKLRLERHKSGRIHFGNRQFDTMSALFTRYAHSEIRPGASLCFPLPCLPPSPALPPPKIRLRRLSSSGPRTQKAGWVMVYSMKNAYTDVPNNGQWKKYWARLDSDRSKDALVLSFFESDKRSRPKQAFVLEHANYVRVSHSLFSKEAVLAVYQKSNENYGSWFKYIHFDTNETCDDWIEQLSRIDRNAERLSIRRHCRIDLDGARGLPAKSLDCLICHDEIPIGRTLAQTGPDIRWSLSENITQMSKMPSTIELLIRKGGSEVIGRVDLNHPKGLEWRQSITAHQLTRDGIPLQGTVIQFGLETKFRLLLPEHEFDELFQLLMSDFTLPCALSTITADSEFDGSVRALAKATLNLYRACRMEVDFCLALLTHELTARELDTASLWRGNSFFTGCIETMIRSSCKPFLVLSLKELVTEMSTLKSERKVDEFVQQALCSMNNTADLFPKEARLILSALRQQVTQKWPGQPHLALRVVANFLFLRFISAAITSPVQHGLCQQQPTAAGQKTLTKVAKVLQQTANGVNADDGGETRELITRLSTPPEHYKPKKREVTTLAQWRRSPNSDYSSDLDAIFEMSLRSRNLLSEVCQTAAEKKCLAVIEYIDGQYGRYKSKLHKCNLLY